MKFKGLLLDLDNTLYGYNRPHKTALSLLLESFSKEFKMDIETVKSNFDLARKITHMSLTNTAASHNRLLYTQKLLEISGINSLPYALKYYNIYWDTFLSEIKLFDSVIGTLEAFAEKGGKIVIVTDLTAHIQYRKIEKLGLEKLVDFVVTSEEVGIEKPSPRMFQTALKKIDCSSDKAVMIGDNWGKDIVGARALKIDSIWLNIDNEKREVTQGITEVKAFNEINLF